MGKQEVDRIDKPICEGVPVGVERRRNTCRNPYSVLNVEALTGDDDEYAVSTARDMNAHSFECSVTARDTTVYRLNVELRSSRYIRSKGQEECLVVFSA